MSRQGEILHTVKLMLTALGILFLGVSVFAYAWGGQSPWPVQAPFDRYIEIGTAQGTRLLERDLAAAHPDGSDAAALLRRLRSAGMDCQVQAERLEQFDCSYRQPRQDRRVAAIDVHFGTRNGRDVAGPIAPAVSAPTR
jgi:hypothetical protein